MSSQEEKVVNDREKHRRNDGVLVADALSTHHNLMVGKICTLIEAILPEGKQCEAAKNMAKKVVRNEETRLCKYLVLFFSEEGRSITNYKENRISLV